MSHFSPVGVDALSLSRGFLLEISDTQCVESIGAGSLDWRLCKTLKPGDLRQPGFYLRVAGTIHVSLKLTKTATELESMIMAELREHPACESAAVVVFGPMGSGWTPC